LLSIDPKMSQIDLLWNLLADCEVDDDENSVIDLRLHEAVIERNAKLLESRIKDDGLSCDLSYKPKNITPLRLAATGRIIVIVPIQPER